jgi:hypothetical protein
MAIRRPSMLTGADWRQSRRRMLEQGAQQLVDELHASFAFKHKGNRSETYGIW